LKNCWLGQPGIEPTATTLDLSSQSGAYDLSATATPELKIYTHQSVGCRTSRSPKSQYPSSNVVVVALDSVTTDVVVPCVSSSGIVDENTLQITSAG